MNCKSKYHIRSYTPQRKASDPIRNLCADILLLAMEDILTPAQLARYPSQNPQSPDHTTRNPSQYTKDLLILHNKALHYFTANNHTFLCSILDLDPITVKKRALTGDAQSQ